MKIIFGSKTVDEFLDFFSKLTAKPIVRGSWSFAGVCVVAFDLPPSFQLKLDPAANKGNNGSAIYGV
jgi:hypothetical protein